MAEEEAGGAASSASGFASMGGDILGKVVGSAVDFGFGQLAAAKQARTVKEMYRKRWRWATGDMRKAGINPILATKSGPGAAPGVALGATGGSPLQFGSTAQRLASANQSRAQAGLVNEQTRTEPVRRQLITTQEREADERVGLLGAQRLATNADRLFKETQNELEQIRVQRAREEFQFAKQEFAWKKRLAEGIGTSINRLENTMGELGVLAGILAFNPGPDAQKLTGYALMALGGPLASLGKKLLDFANGKSDADIEAIIEQLPPASTSKGLQSQWSNWPGLRK